MFKLVHSLHVNPYDCELRPQTYVLSAIGIEKLRCVCEVFIARWQAFTESMYSSSIRPWEADNSPHTLETSPRWIQRNFHHCISFSLLRIR
ncbi:hypothetical protein MPTK1_Vg00390 [Marchantia polymorpha subsp. ruderalis]|uniref:Uncharacterized protein n=1 Tax=Marchantia polymorpha TaxID=3197 RepID=A0A2R6VWQ0_MARPO|nr:hypothetical protein MARPO_YB0013 [Marchantia polymorpha]BBN20518.1 hypothetical protein Mp_Vg00390 [Marchantia polymorpha subsp. ruderalis]PTQ26035.1 hypothetical protein MARPO_YB0013 [Marchantia polymorpha]PTQ26036.1 hypothetical protein MARPO_YB0013 [Marchantia polymorpha]PTQ26037.1 hypothetical protein MARPO_YB0013 [Marchantia polymorpha]|eukprot:PTQ26034.1 hypothetical protein MARPO_YB0013 [Marchantia polymorpha]